MVYNFDHTNLMASETTFCLMQTTPVPNLLKFFIATRESPLPMMRAILSMWQMMPGIPLRLPEHSQMVPLAVMVMGG